MMTKKCICYLLCAIFLHSFIHVPVFFANDNICIIANNSVPVDTLTTKDLKNIFLGIKKKWPDKSKINFIILGHNSREHAVFLFRYINKTPQQYTIYWRRQMFLGKGIIPPAFRSESEIIKYIAKTNGAIGYIVTSVSPVGVKKIAISDL